MKVTVLAENTSQHGSLEAEHGLSMLVEAGDTVLLFDTGCGEMFIRNAEKLGVDLSRVTHLVLSHGHYDHAGGIPTFLRVNAQAKVYLKKAAFTPAYATRAGGKAEFIGVPPGIEGSPRVVFATDGMEIAQGVTLYSDFVNDEPVPETNRGLLTEHDGELVPDAFAHEQVAEVREGGKALLLTACSHHGIGNILRNYHEKTGRWPDAIIGGFHLLSHTDGPAAAHVLDAAAAAIAQSGAAAYTCHCTGEASLKGLQARLGGQVRGLSGGQTLVF
ncbi:MAG TPA: MBL fold metallo-hydrolase [Candidatus Limnocylindria bacterium]|nr:MBL fold metallo-hydrolase [Candidatus Limnocylindria bacterium]